MMAKNVFLIFMTAIICLLPVGASGQESVTQCSRSSLQVSITNEGVADLCRITSLSLALPDGITFVEGVSTVNTGAAGTPYTEMVTAGGSFDWNIENLEPGFCLKAEEANSVVLSFNVFTSGTTPTGNHTADISITYDSAVKATQVETILVEKGACPVSSQLAPEAPAVTANWGFELVRLTDIPVASGTPVFYELQVSCLAVADPACTNGQITLDIPDDALDVLNLAVPASPLVQSVTMTPTGAVIDLIDAFPAGASGSVLFTITPPNGITPDGYAWTVDAVIDGDNTNPASDQSDGSSTATPNINVLKWGPGGSQDGQTLLVGSPITYSLVPCTSSFGWDTGQLWLENGKLIDTLPAEAVFDSATAGGEYDADTHTVTWDIPGILPMLNCVFVNTTYQVTVIYPSTLFLPLSVTNTVKLTGTPIGETEPLEVSDVLRHTVAGATPSGYFSKMVSSLQTNRYGDFNVPVYAGDLVPDDYDLRWDLRVWNRGNIPIGVEFIESVPCLDNNNQVPPNLPIYESYTDGTLCAKPAFVTESLRINRNDVIQAYDAGWRPQYVTNTGTTGIFEFTPPLLRGDMLFIPSNLPADQTISKIVYPYHPLIQIDPNRNLRMFIHGHVVEDDPVGIMPVGALVLNTGQVTFYAGGNPVISGSDASSVKIIGPDIAGSIVKYSNRSTSGGNPTPYSRIFVINNSSHAEPLVITDLLPAGLTLDMDRYGEGRACVFPPHFLNCNTIDETVFSFEVISNYNGTGRQLIRVSTLPGQLIPPGGVVYLLIPYDETVLTPGDHINTANLFLGTSTTGEMSCLSTSGGLFSTYTNDEQDLNGNGITTEDHCNYSDTITIPPKTYFLESVKKVKGDLDSDDFQGFPSVGLVSGDGGTGQYEITFTNSGASPLTNFVLYDILPYVGDTGVSDAQSFNDRLSDFPVTLTSPVTGLPAGAVVEYSDSTNPCRPEVGIATGCDNNWNADPSTFGGFANVRSFKITMPTLAIGESVTIVYPVSVPDNLDPGDVAWNSFAVATDKIEPAEPPKVGLAVPQSDISLEKIIGPALVAVGEEFTMSITVYHDAVIVSNPDGSAGYVDRISGDPTGAVAPATNVVIGDALPTGMTIVPGSSPASYDESTNEWTVGDIYPGQSFTLNLTATLSDVGSYENVAEVINNDTIDKDSTPDNDDGNQSEDDEDNAVVAAVAPVILLHKLVEDRRDSDNYIEADDTDNEAGEYYIGQPIRYRFVVENPTGLTLSNIVVTDPLIAGFCEAGTLTVPTLGPNESVTFNCEWPLGFSDVTKPTINTATVNADYNDIPLTDTDPAKVVIQERLIIGDFIWHDLDGDGVQDPDEPGIPGVVVEIRDGDGIVIATLTTDANGLYGLSVLPGDYTVQVLDSNFLAGGALEGMGPTVDYTGDDTADNDRTQTVIDADLLTYDFGYWNPLPDIDIEKATNTEDADIPTGPFVLVDGTVAWTYVVTNIGNVTLDPVTVTDSKGVAVTCPQTSLAPVATMTCTASGIATADQYNNTGEARGTPVDGNGETVGDPVEDTDPSHYYGVIPGIDVEKSTNGEDADDPTGPVIPVDGAVTWEYVVTNTGDTALTDVSLTDDQGVTITCPDGLPISLLVPGETVTCTATGLATAGQYENNATTVGTPAFPTDPPSGFDPDVPTTYPKDPGAYDDIKNEDGTSVVPVTDEDPSHYFGTEPAIDVEKSTNTEDADDPTGPVIPVDGAVTWEYVVTNTGNTALTGVTLTDDRGVTITCPGGLPISLLIPGDTVTCTATGTATEGQYENNVTAVGKPVFPADPTSGFDPDVPTTYPKDPGAYDDIKNEDGTSVEPVTDEDPSHYFGGNPKIMLVKSVTSVVDTTGDGLIGVGDTITYKFEVTNTGNLYLAPVTISDAKLGIADAPCVDSLAVGATATCSTTGSYVLIQADVDAGGVENTAVTTGQPADPDTGEPLVDPITGQPLPPVTDISDTGTPPTINDDPIDPVVDPETVETPNPLEENPNNPDDNTEDPTTVLIRNPKIMLVKSVTSVVDTTGDGLIGVGDTITYKFEVTNTGNLYLAPVTISDAKLGIADAPCVDSLAVGATATCSTTGSYVLTQADVDAGGVENTAITTGQPADPDTGQPLVDPITGQPLPPVTDISDTGTPPDGTTPIPNPEGVETPNPLGENPNNPGDPTEDPTTVLLKPAPRITPSTPSTPSPTPKVTPTTPAAPECNLTVAIVDVNAKQLPDAILVEADPRFNTARAMYAVSEIQEVSDKLDAFGVSEGDPLLKTMPRYLSTYAGHNLGSLTFQSGMGLDMELSPSMIAKMAADAGLKETPAIHPLLAPFEEGWPVQPDHDSLLWSTEDVETDLVPEALGQTLAAQSALLPELAASDNAEERFAASVMAMQMRESAAFAAAELFKGEDGAYMPHRMQSDANGDITVKDASSRLADQAAMLRGLVKMNRAFKAAGIPQSTIVFDLMVKIWDAMEMMHWNESLGIYETSYDPETDKRSGRVEVYPVQLAALALHELTTDSAFGPQPAERLKRVLGFVRDHLVAEDGGVYAAYDTKSGKIESEEGYALGDMAGALRILLLSDATVDTANTVFAAMEKDLWDHDKGMYRDHTKWDYDAEYTPVSVATTMAALTAMADKIDAMGENASAILGKLSRFHDRVLYRSGLQREGNRLSPFMQADRLIVGDTQDVTYSREPVTIPSRLLADPVPETGLGKTEAPVLVKSIRMDLIPDDAEALLQLQDSDEFRLDREAPRTPLYLPPARLPKRSWRMSVDPETVQTATGLLYDAANVMKAQSVTTDNAFMTDPSILGPTADRIADLVGDYEPVSAEAFVKEQWPALAERFNWTGGEFSPDGPVTAEEVGLFAETAGRVSAALPANHAEKEVLKQASAASARFIMDQMNAASGEVTGLYPATASSDARDAVEDGIGNQAAPILGLLRAYEQTGDTKFLDGALAVYRAISEKRWDHALGIFLSREDRMHLSDTDTLRYQYTDLDIAATLYALSELLRYTDGDLKHRIAENAVQFATHLLPEPAGVSDGEVTGVDVLLGGRNKVYPGDTLGITIVVKNTDEEGNPLGALADLSVTNYLPGGFAYVPRSGRLNRVESITPEISGTELRFNVDKTDDDGNITIEFNAKMSRNVQAAELKNKIVANGRTKEGGEGLCKPAFGEDVFNVGAKGSIKGKVFTDIDGNGAMGPGEKGLDGIRVLLDGNRDSFTDHTGAWNFDDLIPGEYEIRVDIATVPAGMRTTNDLLLIFPLKEGKTFIHHFGVESFTQLSE